MSSLFVGHVDDRVAARRADRTGRGPVTPTSVRAGCRGGPLPVGTAPAPGTLGAMHSVVLYTRPGCHLCDVARVVVQAVVADLGATCAEVDIRSSPELLLEYATRIPVVEVDGREHAHFRVDADRLRQALGGGGAIGS